MEYRRKYSQVKWIEIIKLQNFFWFFYKTKIWFKRKNRSVKEIELRQSHLMQEEGETN